MNKIVEIPIKKDHTLSELIELFRYEKLNMTTYYRIKDLQTEYELKLEHGFGDNQLEEKINYLRLLGTKVYAGLKK